MSSSCRVYPCVAPQALKAGGTIAIISPAAPSERAKMTQGIAYLQQLGYHVQLMPHALDSNTYLAGSDATRLADLHAAFADPTVDAILCARGGFGTTRLLEKIDWDLIKANPKIFIGFSDLTAFLIPMFERTGLIGFHGPMLTSNLILPGVNSSSATLSHTMLWDIVCGRQTVPYEIPIQPQGYHCLQKGTATGKLMGGNLSLLAALCGTPWQPNLEGTILFIEDWHERFYSIDRQWTQMRQAGLLKGIQGVVLGEFCEMAPGDDFTNFGLPELFKSLILDLPEPVPAGLGFQFGHGDWTATLPVGVTCRFEAEAGRLEVLSSPVVP